MLSNDTDHGIRKVLNGTAPNPEVESEGIRADIIAAVWGSGPVLPTGLGETWVGRTFYVPAEDAVYLHTGTRWQAISRGETSAWVTVGNAAGSQPRAQYRKSSGVVEIIGTLTKGTGFGLFTLPAGFRPGGDTWSHDMRYTEDGTRGILIRASGSVEFGQSAAGEVTFNVRFRAAA